MMLQTFFMIIKISEQWRNIVDVFIFEAQQMLKDLLERIFDSDGSKCIVVFNAYNFIYYFSCI